MQIRELTLKELDIAWDVVKELRDALDYKEFEDLIYEMRDINYTMIGIFEKDELITYAGVNVTTNLYHKRHLFVYELVTLKRYRSQGYGKLMLEYLHDYAKMAACENLVLSSGFAREDAHRFYETQGFAKVSYMFVKVL